MQYISTFQAFVYIVFANVPLTEACHLAMPGFKGWKKITPLDGMGCKVTLQMSVHIDLRGLCDHFAIYNTCLNLHI